jgi:GNAT superfamily N-acetyltransferase
LSTVHTSERGISGVQTGVVIQGVTDLRQLHSWFRATRSVTFDDDKSSSDHRRRLYATLGLGADCPWRHWLATDRGCPVGTASALFTGDVVALEHVGVIPEHRRRGIGSALTLAPIAAARSTCRGARALREPAAHGGVRV